jgi:hypothetical protein
MQYLVSVIFEGDGLATPDEMAAIDEFNDRIRADGHWAFAAGLEAAPFWDRRMHEGRGEPPRPSCLVPPISQRGSHAVSIQSAGQGREGPACPQPEQP